MSSLAERPDTGGDPLPAPYNAAHVAGLNQLVSKWRRTSAENRFVPWFDPQGAGSSARILLLLESPGPRTVAAGDSGVSSLDNDDPTSRRLRLAMEEAYVSRALCVRWNVVPWALHDEEGRRRAPGVPDLEDARPALSALVQELHELKVVITFGAHALDGWMRHLTLTEGAFVIPTLAVPHPSPTNGHRRQEAYTRTVTAFKKAAQLAAPKPHCAHGCWEAPCV